jgi:hypothetical protein
LEFGGVDGMRDAVETIEILVIIAAMVYVRVKLWSIFFPDEDYVPFMGPKKIQTLFGDDPDKKS